MWRLCPPLSTIGSMPRAATSLIIRTQRRQCGGGAGLQHAAAGALRATVKRAYHLAASHVNIHASLSIRHCAMCQTAPACAQSFLQAVPAER